jgi:hypothetical protein
VSDLGVYNQVTWPGVGDADDCWVIATFWSLVAGGVLSKDQLPSVRAFREAAGVPDRRGKADGGNNAQILRALRKLAPKSGAYLYSSGMSGFVTALKKGYVASVSVRSGMLPKNMQFGFKGAHQISVVAKDGKLYVMNPLAQSGSALMEISEADLRRAAAGLMGDGKVHAVMIKIGVRTYKSVVATIKGPTVLQPPSYRTNFLNGFDAKAFYDARHKKPKDGRPVDLV